MDNNEMIRAFNESALPQDDARKSAYFLGWMDARKSAPIASNGTVFWKKKLISDLKSVIATMEAAQSFPVESVDELADIIDLWLRDCDRDPDRDQSLELANRIKGGLKK
jgi:hypothetical protein